MHYSVRLIIFTYKMTTKKATGTREWAEKNINFITGCSHNCKYCYSKEMAIRFKRTTADTWIKEKVRKDALSKSYKKEKGRIMFPSSHDITPDHIKEAIIILGKLLKSGNTVLIVTKPHLECIKAICTEFTTEKKQIIFRFTIGSANSDILKFWEPNAPSFDERVKALKYAYSRGFQTSVSCEPMLDTNVSSVIDAVLPFVTDTIWIGKANNLIARMKINGVTDKISLTRAEQLVEWQSSSKNVLKLYAQYKDNPKIEWKDSIHRMIQNGK